MLHPLHAGHTEVLEGGESIAPFQRHAGAFIAAGIEHSTAPVTVRELVALSGETLEEAHRTLIAHPALEEVVILSTCNRTELYLFTDDASAALAAAGAFLESKVAGARPHLRQWRDIEAIEHLFRVTAGLESQVVGERQIMSQVRGALTCAEGLATTGPNLHQLFRSAIACARDAHKRCDLGRIDRSIAAEAVRSAEGEIGSLNGRRALIIGGGAVSREAARELRSREVGALYLANRTPATAAELAERHGGQAIGLPEVGRVLPTVELVISATSAPGRILTADDARGVDFGSRRAPLHIYDLAMPRDVDPAIGSLPGVVLRDLDSVVPGHLREHQEHEVRAAEAIVEHHVIQFRQWHGARRLAPAVAGLRRALSSMAAAELAGARPRLASLTEDEMAAVESLAHGLTNRIFHQLVTRARVAVTIDEQQVGEALAFLLSGFTGAEESGARHPLDIGA